MNTERKLRLAVELMNNVNKAHSFVIFMDVKLIEAEEEIQYDVMTTQVHHAVDICRLLNLTFYMTPVGDKIKFFILP